MIYEDFSEKILSLEYKPGMPFSENDVCEMYKASRTPVRTALQRLADKGLIDLLPYQKTRVSKIDLEAVKQLIYSRAAIEDRGIRDFMTLDDPLLIEDVEHLIRKQQIVLASEDFSLNRSMSWMPRCTVSGMRLPEHCPSGSSSRNQYTTPG